MLRQCWSAGAVLFLALWLGLMLIGRSALFRDPGTFWHVVLGREVLETGRVPWTDTFSFTFHGRPSLADQWLAECLMAAVHWAAGWDGLLLVTAATLAGVYAWIGGRLVRSGLHWLPATLVLALALMAGSHNFHARPLVATIALQAVSFAWLLDVEAARVPVRRLWWLVPLFIHWTNLHGGVLGAVGTLALAAAAWFLAWLTGWPSPVGARRDACVLGAITAACALSTLASPYGAALPGAWLRTLSMPLPELIQEHGRLRLTEVYGWSAAVLAAGYVAVLLGAGRARAAWLLPLVWFVLAVQRVRNLPLFGVMAALALAEVLPRSRAGAWLEARGFFRRTGLLARPGDSPRRTGLPARPRRPWKAVLLPAALVAVAATVQVAGLRAPVVGRGWVRFDPARWPAEMEETLHAVSAESPEGTPLFNDLDLGGFVIYHAPRLRVFIDDRCALYGAEFLRAYDHARRNEPEQLDRWRARYGFRLALVQRGGRFDRYLGSSGDWRLTARDPAASLYRWAGP